MMHRPIKPALICLKNLRGVIAQENSSTYVMISGEKYIWLALNSTDVRDQIERPIRSAVGLKNVNLTEFGALTFPLPPFAEQHRIVAKVNALMALCDRLEASLAATASTRRRLLEALLAEALAPAEDRKMEAAE